MSPDLTHSLLILAAALMIDAGFGYPQGLVVRIGHPVMLFGAMIAWLDRHLNRDRDPAALRRLAGVVALGLALGVFGFGAWVMADTLRGFPYGWLIEAILASTLLAARSLHQHVAAVVLALRLHGLDGGRRAVSMIVGRDPTQLDRAGVARAAIESLAENFSDGVVSPALWLAVGGLPGIVLFKVINTADSMIGHLSPRHAAFGWAAARVDDLVNLPGARLTAALIAAAALISGNQAGIGRAGASGAVRACRADAHRHRSPNAGWPEAAMAGALGLRLGGPRRYGGERVDGAWLGDGRAEAEAEDIDRALALFRRAVGIGLALCVAAALACAKWDWIFAL